MLTELTMLLCLYYCQQVADFGFARCLKKTRSHRTTAACGTFSHSAPELMRLGRLSPAADVYAFGITLWEVLTGREAFAGLHCGQIFEAVVLRQERPGGRRHRRREGGGTGHIGEGRGVAWAERQHAEDGAGGGLSQMQGSGEHEKHGAAGTSGVEGGAGGAVGGPIADEQQEEERDDGPGDPPAAVRALMELCWRANPAERPSMEEVAGQLHRLLEELTLQQEQGGDAAVGAAAGGVWSRPYIPALPENPFLGDL